MVPPLPIATIVSPPHVLPASETETADGIGFIVITLVKKHPVGRIYEIKDVPVAIPTTLPEVEFMVATDEVLLDQIPPPEHTKVVDVPVQTVVPPLIPDGLAFTVTVVVYIVDGLHPANPLPFVTVSEYTVVTVGVAVGFWAVFEDKSDPLQLYLLAPPPGFAYKLTVPPTQIEPLLVGTAKGNEFTITVDV